MKTSSVSLACVTILCAMCVPSLGWADCKATCDKFYADDAKCGAPPAGCPKRGSLYVAGKGAAADEWQALCAGNNFDSKWGQTRSHCDAMKTSKEGAQGELISAGVYTAAAAVCLTACLTEANMFTAVTDHIICMSGSILAAGTDIGLAITLTKNAASAIGSGVMGIAAGASMATTEMGSEEVESCIAAGATTIMAGVKWYLYSKTLGASSEECGAVDQLNGPAKAHDTSGSGVTSSNPTYTAKGGSTNGTTTSPSTESTDSAGGVADSYLQGKISAATAGVPSSFPREALKNTADKLKLDVGALTNRLATESPTSILGGLPFSNDKLRDILAQTDALVKSGNLFEEGRAPTAMAYSGGGGGGAAKSGASSGDGAIDLASLFGAKKDDKKSNDSLGLLKLTQKGTGANDIWHAQSTQSIFEIVTDRIGKSKTQLTQAEWASPLNKALMGVSNKKPETGTAKK